MIVLKNVECLAIMKQAITNSCWLDVPLKQLCDKGSYLPESSVQVMTGVKQENIYKKDRKDSIKTD